MQQKSAHNHQRMFRILITTAAIVRNIRLMVDNIFTSHMGIAYHVEHNAQGTQPHHGFSRLVARILQQGVKKNKGGIFLNAILDVPGSQTWNGGHRCKMKVTGITVPPLATALGFSLLISVEYVCVEHYPLVYCTQ